jgi:hypothetical protein
MSVIYYNLCNIGLNVQQKKDLGNWEAGDQTLNSKNSVVISMCEVLERKDRRQAIPYESDADKTDEEIVEGLMEITALSLADEPKRDDFVEGIIESLKDFVEGRCTVFKDDDELEAHLMSL